MSIGLVTHFYNEEVLLPHWINHHLPQVYDCVLINHASTDNSVEIIRQLAPHWRVINTKMECFDAHLLDQEVMQVEEEYLNTDWKMTLNTTEFLFRRDLNDFLREYKNLDAIVFSAYMMVDRNLNLPLDEPLWLNRTNGYLDDGSAMNSRRGRSMHRHKHGHYNLGRHGCSFPNYRYEKDTNLLFASFSPWPQAVGRKLQIQTRIPMSDKQAGFGIQHLQNHETLNNFYNSELAKTNDLLLDDNFKINYDYFKEQWRLTYV